MGMSNALSWKRCAPHYALWHYSFHAKPEGEVPPIHVVLRWRGVVWCGVVWCGVCSMVWCGVVRIVVLSSIGSGGMWVVVRQQ